MKYLKFYEAFKSKGISNTLNFLRNKVGSSSQENFLEYLRQFMQIVDFPIDKISDDESELLDNNNFLKKNIMSLKRMAKKQGVSINTIIKMLKDE